MHKNRHPKIEVELTNVGSVGNGEGGDNVVANAGQPDPPFTRAGSQDAVSYTNSLKLKLKNDVKSASRLPNVHIS